MFSGESISKQINIWKLFHIFKGISGNVSNVRSKQKLTADLVSFASLSFNMVDASSDFSAHSKDRQRRIQTSNTAFCVRKRRAVPNH